MSQEIRHEAWKPGTEPATAMRALADAGFFFYGEYAYFWAYFFVSPHAERRVGMS